MSDEMVVKASGEKVPFERKKLIRSLERAGAGQDMIEEILKVVETEIRHKELSTRNIYQKAFSLLKKKSRHLAARYRLKRAISELGPSGYPFEHLVAELLNFQGYQTQVGVRVKGRCLEHEVDVLASKDGEVILVECKFRRNHQDKNDVKIPLYVHSRFKDIEQEYKKNGKPIVHFWIATNAKFTEDALRYAYCSDIYLLSWSHPQKGNLKERIEMAGLHPLTCLTTLTKKEKEHLLEKDVVLSRHLVQHPELLDTLQLKPVRRGRVLKEVEGLIR